MLSYSAKKFLILQAAGLDWKNIPKSDKPYYQRLVQLYENFIPDHLQNKVKKEMSSQIKNQQNMGQQLKVDANNEKEEEKDLKAESTPDSSVALLGDDKLNQEKLIVGYGSLNDEILNRPICPKVVLLGLDQVYNKESGIAEPHNTSVYTPEYYVDQVVNENRHVFVLGPSINPYRKDCIDKLIEFKNKGCNVIKWLPNSMGIDPMHKKCDAFFDKLAELDMFLLTHTGQEHSLDDADYTVQEYGNPLRFRGALQKGVKIIMAHCASEGDDEDLDDEKVTHDNVNSCELFIRMMREDKYKGLLFGDISAITSVRRTAALLKIIQCSDFHDRLIYGTDYPIPAINGAIWYNQLVSKGFLTAEQAVTLREIFKYNPILADFVHKRVMRYTDENGKVHKFADAIFQQSPLICGNMGVSLSVKQKKNQ